MAIFSFGVGEGVVEGFSPDGQMLAYALLDGRGRGWLHCEKAWDHVQRVRSIESGEAGRLAAFFLQAGILSRFKQRMAPEDWGRIMDGLPDAAGVAA
jgi:hypothetical protein